VKLKRQNLILRALAVAFAGIGLFAWLRESPREAFIRVVGFTPPPSVANLRAIHDGGFQTSEDVLSFRIASSDFPLLLQKRSFTELSKSDISPGLGIDIEQLDHPPITNPIYFGSEDRLSVQNVDLLFTIRTNPERASVIFRRIFSK